MRAEVLFFNGVYDEVLERIAKVQAVLPQQILYLQPYAGGAIAKLRDDPPTPETPMLFLASTTKDLPTVHYVGEIVGWDDKRTLSNEKRKFLDQIIRTLQGEENGLYDSAQGEECVNLIHIRGLKKLKAPFNVERLVKISDGQSVSPARTTAGGWVYVRANNLDGLLST